MTDADERPATATPRRTIEIPPPVPDLLDEYRGEIVLRLERLPGLQPRVLPTRSASRWRRFLAAGRRRSFTLVRDFEIEVDGGPLRQALRGTLVIPRAADGVDNVFDGASIPFPWIVSYMSFGVLRPLGVLLSASVVHDFAFQFGFLPVRRDGETREVALERHEADELFRLIAATLNRSRVFSRLAWHAVRLGWWGIPYAGRRFGGKPPLGSTALALVAALVAAVLGVVVSRTWLDGVEGFRVPAALVGLVVAAMSVVYLWIWVENRRRGERVDSG